MILVYGTAEEINGGKAENKKIAESAAGKKLFDILLIESGVAATSEDIKTGEQGKPYLAELPNVDFNITHSNGFVACILSVGEGRVGIDAEPAECSYPAEKQKALATRFFSEDEQKSLSAGDKTFAQLWTRREAALKMTGEGFAKGIGQELPQNVHFTTLTIGGFTLTVAAEQTANIVVKEYMK